ncbi:Peptide-N4-(N-acetyl-beta-glucosaminyl)asparagine amidase A [Vitis vinifera]|uniref:Peptide-N4-(N-acetyl-beta-glucosaminyl)asparagine amidase A n=1 Tax=Vitis vinifera TaxID=29760 RepID=A0A438E5Q0_VITVI|nr:Peptide-N4-(N-acetyl-beta-glucosaminyl)asparagine amidase A [Vitis vinifera]
MASSSFMRSLLLFHLFFFFSLLYPLSSTAQLYKLTTGLGSKLLSHPKPLKNPSPTRFFEVTKPVKVPKTKPCSSLVLQHDFASTYGKPPVIVPYSPPSHCPSQNFSKIVLKWTATCKGRQFDRIFGVWLDGVELLRSCTAEPKATGIVWTVEKDITRYSSLLLKSQTSQTQTLAVYMGNIVDETYTGVYHVNLSFHFYPADDSNFLKSGYGSRPDLILPISRNLPLNDGLWFEIQNQTHVEGKEFIIPKNAYRAVLEVYVSFHENDEFWYLNPPNDYIDVNNLTGSIPGNSAFREVLVSLDGELVGAVWPFTVIHTGGVNPLLWRPISAIGSFNLPSYDIEITPFLGNLLDGKSHGLGFSVTNALNVWFIDANLHLWLDNKSKRTQGKLLGHNSKSSSSISTLSMEGLNASFLIHSTRSISSVDGSNRESENPSYKRSSFYIAAFFNLCCQSTKTFPLNLYYDIINQGNGNFVAKSKIKLGFNEKRSKKLGSTSSKIALKNLQKGRGNMHVEGNLVTNGTAATSQVYEYVDPKGCYFRNVSSSNGTILYDEASNSCSVSVRSIELE